MRLSLKDFKQGSEREDYLHIWEKYFGIGVLKGSFREWRQVGVGSQEPSVMIRQVVMMLG